MRKGGYYGECSQSKSERGRNAIAHVAAAASVLLSSKAAAVEGGLYTFHESKDKSHLGIYVSSHWKDLCYFLQVDVEKSDEQSSYRRMEDLLELPEHDAAADVHKFYCKLVPQHSPESGGPRDPILFRAVLEIVPVTRLQRTRDEIGFEYKCEDVEQLRRFLNQSRRSRYTTTAYGHRQSFKEVSESAVKEAVVGRFYGARVCVININKPKMIPRPVLLMKTFDGVQDKSKVLILPVMSLSTRIEGRLEFQALETVFGEEVGYASKYYTRLEYPSSEPGKAPKSNSECTRRVLVDPRLKYDEGYLCACEYKIEVKTVTLLHDCLDLVDGKKKSRSKVDEGGFQHVCEVAKSIKFDGNGTSQSWSRSDRQGGRGGGYGGGHPGGGGGGHLGGGGGGGGHSGGGGGGNPGGSGGGNPGGRAGGNPGGRAGGNPGGGGGGNPGGGGGGNPGGGGGGNPGGGGGGNPGGGGGGNPGGGGGGNPGGGGGGNPGGGGGGRRGSLGGRGGGGEEEDKGVRVDGEEVDGEEVDGEEVDGEEEDDNTVEDNRVETYSHENMEGVSEKENIGGERDSGGGSEGRKEIEFNHLSNYHDQVYELIEDLDDLDWSWDGVSPWLPICDQEADDFSPGFVPNSTQTLDKLVLQMLNQHTEYHLQNKTPRPNLREVNEGVTSKFSMKTLHDSSFEMLMNLMMEVIENDTEDVDLDREILHEVIEDLMKTFENLVLKEEVNSPISKDELEIVLKREGKIPWNIIINNLVECIKWDDVECYNQVVDHNFKNALREENWDNDDLYLECEDDEEEEKFLLKLCFWTNVKVTHLIVKSPPGKGPTTLELFVNKPNMGCGDEEKVTQTIELKPENLEGEPVKLEAWKFQSVESLQVRAKGLEGETAQVTKFALIGSTKKTTDASKLKRECSMAYVLTQFGDSIK